eukprot:Gb_23932 [translate_table: standard]
MHGGFRILSARILSKSLSFTGLDLRCRVTSSSFINIKMMRMALDCSGTMTNVTNASFNKEHFGPISGGGLRYSAYNLHFFDSEKPCGHTDTVLKENETSDLLGCGTQSLPLGETHLVSIKCLKRMTRIGSQVVPPAHTIQVSMKHSKYITPNQMQLMIITARPNPSYLYET